MKLKKYLKKMMNTVRAKRKREGRKKKEKKKQVEREKQPKKYQDKVQENAAKKTRNKKKESKKTEKKKKESFVSSKLICLPKKDAVSSIIFNVDPIWKKQFKKNIISPFQESVFNAKELEIEKKKAFDLIDALTKSGK